MIKSLLSVSNAACQSSGAQVKLLRCQNREDGRKGGAQKVKYLMEEFYHAAEVSAEEGARGRRDNMYLFILLYKVYLIVTVTCLECMSATGLSFFFFEFP